MKLLKKFLPLIILFIFTASLYGFSQIKDLGLYEDNWKYMKDFYFQHNWSYYKYFRYFLELYPTSVYRISLIFTAPLVGFIGEKIHNIPLAVNLLSFFLNYLFVLNTYYFIKYIRPASRPIYQFLITFFLTTYIGKSTTLYWGATHVQVIAFMLALTAINTVFYCRNKYTKIFLIMLFSCVSVWSYETVIFIPIAVMFAQIIKNYKNNENCDISKGIIYKKVFYYTVVSVIGVGLAVIFKLYIFSNILGYVSPKISQENSLVDNVNVTNYIKLLINIYKNIGFPGLFNYYEKVININPSIEYFIVFLLLSQSLLKKTKETKNKNKVDSAMIFIIFGILFYLGSILVLSITSGNLNINPFSIDNRKLMIPSFGLALIIVGVILTASRRYKIIGIFIITLLTVLNVLTLNTERRAYINSWSYQSRVIKGIQDNIEFTNIDGKRVLFIGINNNNYDELGVPQIYASWTLAHIMGYITQNRNVQGIFVKDINSCEERDEVLEKWRNSYEVENIYIVDLKEFKLYPINSYCGEI